MKKAILSFLYIALFSMATAPVWAAAEIKTDKQKLSYALGAYFSQGIAQQNVDMDIPAFLQAIEDVLKNSELKLNEEEIQTVLMQYQEKLSNERNNAADSNKAASEKFLAENKKKEGVTTLPNGIQYKVLKEGNGPKPKSDSEVQVHYHGTHINGEVFDSSYDRGEPLTLSLTQVIKGWQEAVPLMSVGSKYQFYIPAELAYGEKGAGTSIGPNEALVFDIELLGIN